MTANGVYAMSALTALTAQNTLGVTKILEVPDDFLWAQMEAVAVDIFPDAVKTGMVSSSSLIKTISRGIREFGFKNLVVDPVMVATSGAKLIGDDAVKTLEDELLPLATVITPNIGEAEVLSGIKIDSREAMEKSAEIIRGKFGCSVLVKGGHNLNDANDFLFCADGKFWFEGRRIQNENTHGTGCTLSSAIASNLAKGENLQDAVKNAKEFVSLCLGAMLNLGKGSGPMNHAFKFLNE
jgi:hydroxymethylpyrimidine/phosphomethylpyrimidine kinase